MRVLLLGLGTAPGRFSPPSTHCENYVCRDLGGHEIITFGYNEGVNIRIDPEDDFKKVIERLPEDWHPDLCVLWLPEWNLLPKGVEQAPFPTVACIFDWDYDVQYSKACVEAVDLVIVSGEADKKAIDAIGANVAEAFYFAGIMSEWIDEKPKKIKDRKYDILYTTWIDDTVQPGRSDWLSKISSLSERYNIHIDKHLPYPEYIKLLRDSKLVLSYNRHGSMAVRTTDAGGQGTVVLETGDGGKKYFIPDQEFIAITEDNFVEKIEFYLHNEIELQRISDRFYKKVLQEFEARNRFLKMLDLVSSSLECKGVVRKVAKLTKSEKFNRRGKIYYYAFFSGSPGFYFIDAGSKLLELSISEFEKAAAINPTAEIMTNLAVATASLNFTFNKDEIQHGVRTYIVRLLEDVISSYPSYALAYFNLGILNLRLGNFDDALKLLNVALEVFQDNATDVDLWCLHNRDYDVFNQFLRRPLNSYLILYCKGHKDEALTKARRLYRSIIFYLGSMIYEEKGDIYKAVEYLKEAHYLNPDSGFIAWRAASRLSIMGYEKDSMALYDKAVQLLPLNVELRNEYMKLLYIYKHDQKLMELLKETILIIKRIGIFNEKAGILKATMDSFSRFFSKMSDSYDCAKEELLSSWVEVLFSFLRSKPENLMVVFRIVEIWKQLGRTEKIIEILEDWVSNFGELYERETSGKKFLIDTFEWLRETISIEENAFAETMALLASQPDINCERL